jgi:hypothetical protein
MCYVHKNFLPARQHHINATGSSTLVATINNHTTSRKAVRTNDLDDGATILQYILANCAANDRRMEHELFVSFRPPLGELIVFVVVGYVATGTNVTVCAIVAKPVIAPG